MDASPENEFLSCDWGTTSFRLRWIRARAVKAEYSDHNGCRAIFDRNSLEGRSAAFEHHLKTAIYQMGVTTPQPIPLLISGMASSTVGWHELPYALLPLTLDASSFRVEKVRWKSPKSVSGTYLISGASSSSEMLRGEETEALGLLESLEPMPNPATLILPGTHSKHLRIENNAITNIQTFMTGELYEVLARHSVLRASVDTTAPTDLVAFRAGIGQAAADGLAGSLFQTRTRQVLKEESPQSNASFLSGLLIGAELLGLKENQNLLIGGADSVRDLYAVAAKQLQLSVAHIFCSDEVKLAVPRAHQLILSTLKR